VMQVGVRDWKGWKELVDAVMAHANVHLALIGCRHQRERAEVTDFVRARGAAERVTLVEVRTDMPNVLAAADLVVDASWAGTGITGTIREAMAMRKPIVATDCGGNRELVSSPDVGWLIAPRDVAALTSAIAEVIDRPERAAEVARNARVHVERGFSKELRISRLETLYADVLRRRKEVDAIAPLRLHRKPLELPVAVFDRRDRVQLAARLRSRERDGQLGVAVAVV